MGVGTECLACADPRRTEREEVGYRTSAVAVDGGHHTLLVVNISPHGLMARCEEPLAAGNRIWVRLPEVGAIEAHVRWSLGGRLGCEFYEAIDLAGYYDLLTALVREE
jgi:hypothetical protein